MSSSQVTSQTGDASDTETKATSVEDLSREVDKATVTDIKESSLAEVDTYKNCVVVPLPEVNNQKSSKYSTSGKEIELTVNGYAIQKHPTKPVYMYELQVIAEIQAQEDKRLLPTLDQKLMRRCFRESKERQRLLPDAIHDGAHIVWSLHKLEAGGIREKISLDPPFRHYEGPKRIGGLEAKNPHSREFLTLLSEVQLRVIPKHMLMLKVIEEWLNKKRGFDELVIQSFTFLDHLIRHGPQSRFFEHKRSYFFENIQDMGPELAKIAHQFHCQLPQSATVYRGAFQTIRACPRGLMLNLDTAYGVFFSRIGLMGVMRGLLNISHVDDLVKRCMPIHRPRIKTDFYESSGDHVELGKMISGLLVNPEFKGCPNPNRVFKIRKLLPSNARNHMLDIKDRATGAVTNMSVQEYFRSRYNVQLEYPDMLLVEMQDREVVYPPELLTLKGLQRYNRKLSARMTALMIKYTAQKPRDRVEHIKSCKSIFAHENDPNLRLYGLEIGKSLLRTKARLLPSPEIQFGNSRHNPGISGRWDLRGKRFYKPHTKPLTCWAIGYYPNDRRGFDQRLIDEWQMNFVKSFKQHGGTVRNPPVSLLMTDDIGTSVTKLHDTAKSAYNQPPQLIIMITGSQDVAQYARLKKSCDCRYGVPSQVLQAERCRNGGKPQLHSNVAMKINAKLGGVTAHARSVSGGAGLGPSSMIIGADVTHPMMGVWTPSLAAMSVSKDLQGIGYWGGREVNGIRKEIIAESNIRTILLPFFKEWIRTVGKKSPPAIIYYFRDGVSETECSEVLKVEVKAIRTTMSKAAGKEWQGKVCVIIANKRHHIRAFPASTRPTDSDKNGNPLPGTLIDREVTSPHGWDFFLYSHIALQGTARPVHYTILLDEVKHEPNHLVNMIYEQCYQYVRSTTSVSVHPAIYYAHLISVRARHHENVTLKGKPAQYGRGVKVSRGMPEAMQANPTESNRAHIPLLPIDDSNDNHLPLGMWYV
ncbi:hypothetical protein N7539_001862 [Penicillium diatomitis]|uniref:Piwi domain-containing protein n=1 Tax=Penicillium diatomitis TaxID=2819901 RepID=A0A9W9XHJ3_9EURO|nr:uncharacterized protein N7539_001862 [Penicillium diatomitis]KAJ5493116.1 hypothetical protein N7539_001862 [Penicillium diatomitis]